MFPVEYEVTEVDIYSNFFIVSEGEMTIRKTGTPSEADEVTLKEGDAFGTFDDDSEDGPIKITCNSPGGGQIFCIPRVVYDSFYAHGKNRSLGEANSLNYIKRLKVFSHFSKKDQEILLSVSHRESFSPDSVICRKVREWYSGCIQ